MVWERAADWTGDSFSRCLFLRWRYVFGFMVWRRGADWTGDSFSRRLFPRWRYLFGFRFWGRADDWTWNSFSRCLFLRRWYVFGFGVWERADDWTGDSFSRCLFSRRRSVFDSRCGKGALPAAFGLPRDACDCGLWGLRRLFHESFSGGRFHLVAEVFSKSVDNEQPRGFRGVVATFFARQQTAELLPGLVSSERASVGRIFKFGTSKLGRLLYRRVSGRLAVGEFRHPGVDQSVFSRGGVNLTGGKVVSYCSTPPRGNREWLSQQQHGFRSGHVLARWTGGVRLFRELRKHGFGLRQNRSADVLSCVVVVQPRFFGPVARVGGSVNLRSVVLIAP